MRRRVTCSARMRRAVVLDPWSKRLLIVVIGAVLVLLVQNHYGFETTSQNNSDSTSTGEAKPLASTEQPRFGAGRAKKKPQEQPQQQKSDVQEDDYLKPKFPRQQCELYMARSTLPNVNGFGMFTTRALSAGDFVLSSFDGPAISIIDYEWHRHNLNGLEDDFRQWRNIFYHYWWAMNVPDHSVYEGDQIYDWQISFGALPNHNCILVRGLCVMWNCHR